MTSVSVTAVLDEDAATVRQRMREVEPFMRAAGFDAVRREGSHLTIENAVGPATIELSLELFDDPDADLAYRQEEGIFEEMDTTYTVTAVDGGTRVEAETEFSLGVAVVGSVLDETVIKRQRRRELNAQFAYLRGNDT
ncbi:hypothetical protein [Halobellus rufus]|uniref:hypothetical protein n=1 Tax=Halobellus rufus TaxID=1448860 RepID=UPI0006798DC7|nr:hypothetical protein [Halobellus rufus]